jgi:predicted nucleic acid-binding protein
MSKVALIDSDVIIGAALERDQHHDRAKPIVDGIDQGQLPGAVLSDYIYMEVVNHLTKKLNTEDCCDFLNRLAISENFRIYRVLDKHYKTGKDEIYYAHSQLSLTDAVSVAFMHDMPIEHCYSFDDDFDPIEDVVRLNADVNPFR